MRRVPGIGLLTALVLIAGPLGADPARGVVLSFESVPPGGEGEPRRDCRLARLVALRVPAGDAPTPFLPPGPFRATWRGSIEVEILDDYTFSVEGRGTIEVEIDGETVIEKTSGDLGEILPSTVELDAGRRQLVVRYEGPTEGDAVVRLLWSSFDFAAEPVRPRVLFHDPADPELRARALVRRGRELVASRRCARCHRPRVAFTEGSMPELADPAPPLEGIGGRLEAAWLARWIADPRSLRHDTAMPNLGLVEEHARYAAAYLAAQAGAATAAIDLSSPELAARGEVLFEELGCIGCHTHEPLEDAASDPDRRVSLAAVAAKWKPAALVEFLLDPRRVSPAGGMPDFRLPRDEATALAAYVRSRATLQLEPVDLGTERAAAERGEELLVAKGCLSCHEAKPVQVAAQPVPGLDAVLSPSRRGRGCLAESDAARSGAPDFGFTRDDLDALRALAAEDIGSLWWRCDVEYAERRVRDLRCGACHRRDGVHDVWSRLRPEEPEPVPPPQPVDGAPPELPQLRPALTWTGEKLRPEWLARFLDGGVAEPVRTWLDARMPVFALRGDLVARGLALGHGMPAEPQPEESPDPELAKVGEELMAQTDGGFSCYTCHDRGARKAEGTFDAKGPDLEILVPRLRKSYYHRWMLDPLRVDPRTKMPQFAVDGRSALTAFFDGDAGKQFEAIWHCLQLAAEARK